MVSYIVRIELLDELSLNHSCIIITKFLTHQFSIHDIDFPLAFKNVLLQSKTNCCLKGDESETTDWVGVDFPLVKNIINSLKHCKSLIMWYLYNKFNCCVCRSRGAGGPVVRGRRPRRLELPQHCRAMGPTGAAVELCCTYVHTALHCWRCCTQWKVSILLLKLLLF